MRQETGGRDGILSECERGEDVKWEGNGVFVPVRGVGQTNNEVGERGMDM